MKPTQWKSAEFTQQRNLRKTRSLKDEVCDT